jgi:ribonuclease HII
MNSSVIPDQSETNRIRRMLRFESVLWNQGKRAVAGLDEAGRGPLAGPVVAAAVVFDENVFIPGIDDSKRLTPQKRDLLFERIQNQARAWGVGIVSEIEIDRSNILRASERAMRKAIDDLHIMPDHLLIDGRPVSGIATVQTAIVRGDRKSFSIAAASILAKVIRDRMMVIYDRLYPDYGFASHKGYGTRRHVEAVQKHGPCAIHRKTFHIKFEAYEGPIGEIPV